MPRPAKRPTDKNRPRGVRWTPSEWRRIQEAVAKLAEQQERRASASEVIRTGTLRRVEEILGAA